MEPKSTDEFQIKQVKIEDYAFLDRYYRMRRPETADSNLLDMYLWGNCYPTWYFTTDKGLMWVAKSEDGQYYSSIPCCKEEDLAECFMLVKRYFNEVLKKKLVMYVVDKQALDTLQLSEEDYVIVEDRTYADYVYDAEKLRTFSGKKFHKKKNNYNYFKRTYEGRYEFKFLHKDSLDEIMQYLEAWKSHKKDTKEHEFIDSEIKGVKYILENEEYMDFKLGAVYIDGKLEAFTIGNYYDIEDMVYLPVEKANPQIRGLYQYICSEFLIQAFPNASKENREDDMGIEGLRKSKLSYNPIYMVDKYTIIEK